MEYQVSIDIQRPASECFSYYTESEKIKMWMPNLKDIVNSKGRLFSLNSQGYFIFDQKGHDMLMEIEVTELKDPYEITIIYRVPGAKNVCVNRFENHNGYTLWIMDVIFEFEEDPNLDIEIFKKSTLSSMEIFKQYMEGKSHA